MIRDRHLYRLFLAGIAFARARRSTGPLSCARIIVGNGAQTHGLLTYPRFLQDLQYIIRHASRQLHSGMIVVDFDVADILAVNVRFIGDRANNFARLDPVRASYFQAVGLQGRIALGTTL